MNYFYMALTILFIYLKLTHAIDWSWWFVLAPIWGGFIVRFLLIAGYVIYVAGWGTPAEKLAMYKKGLLK